MKPDRSGADQRWARYMLWRPPDRSVVRDETLRRCDRSPDSVDDAQVFRAVDSCARQWLLELTAGRTEFGSELGLLLDPTRFDLADFTDYLSTKGAVGVAVSNKLAAFLTVVLPVMLAERVRSGEFDR